jgi:2-dehydropantoate 2-reductase
MAGLEKVTADRGMRVVARAMIIEEQAVAEKLGVTFPLEVDARIGGAVEVGVHKPSTLIDFERGQPMETDALLGAVAEMGRLVRMPTRICDAIFELVRRRPGGRRLYPARKRAALVGHWAGEASGLPFSTT